MSVRSPSTYRQSQGHLSTLVNSSTARSLKLVDPKLVFLNFIISQLGFAGGRATPDNFGDVYTSDFAMDDIHCEGDEEHLQDCSYSSVDNCNIGEGAGVICHY